MLVVYKYDGKGSISVRCSARKEFKTLVEIFCGVGEDKESSGLGGDYKLVKGSEWRK